MWSRRNGRQRRFCRPLSGWTGPSDPQLSAAEPLVKIISEMSRRYGSDILPVDVAID